MRWQGRCFSSWCIHWGLIHTKTEQEGPVFNLGIWIRVEQQEGWLLELLRSIGEPITTWGYLNLNQLKWNEKFFSHISHNSYAQLPYVAVGYLLKSPDIKHFYSFRKVMLDSAANHRDIKTAGDACGLLFSAGTWSVRFSTHIWKGCRSVKSQEIQELRSCCCCASRTLNVQPYHLGIFKCRY